MSSINGAARLMKDASPTPTSLEGQHRIIIDDEGPFNTKSKKQHQFTYMRQNVIDQKSNELPHPAAAKVQIDNPTPISLKGLWLQGGKYANL